MFSLFLPFFLCYLPSPNVGLTPSEFITQMLVGYMPVGGATDCGPEHINKGWPP